MGKFEPFWLGHKLQPTICKMGILLPQVRSQWGNNSTKSTAETTPSRALPQARALGDQILPLNAPHATLLLGISGTWRHRGQAEPPGDEGLLEHCSLSSGCFSCIHGHIQNRTNSWNVLPDSVLLPSVGFRNIWFMTMLNFYEDASFIWTTCRQLKHHAV